MKPIIQLDKIVISVHSRKILLQLLAENPILEKILRFSASEKEALNGIRNWILPKLKRNAAAEEFFMSSNYDLKLSSLLNWEDMAAIRVLDYIAHAGEEYHDQNIGGEIAVTNPIKMLWLASNFGTGGAKAAFFNDMLKLFRQLNGKFTRKIPSKKEVGKWMDRFPSGIEPKIIQLRISNRKRIIATLTQKIDNKEINSKS